MTRAEKLAKKQQELATITENLSETQSAYIEEIESNPAYSLQVDPEDKYKMGDLQKKFIEHYVNFKNVNTAAELTGIDQDTAKQFFIAYSTQQEIRRINLALYQRQFCNRLLSIDEIGGYLTSLLTGENVPIADQARTITDKLRIVTMLIELNKLKSNGMQDPTVIMQKNIDIQIKDLSVQTIRQLIDTQESMADKQKVIEVMNTESNLTPEEEAYLSTLPTEDLLNLIEQSNKEKKNESQ